LVVLKSWSESLDPQQKSKEKGQKQDKKWIRPRMHLSDTCVLVNSSVNTKCVYSRPNVT